MKPCWATLFSYLAMIVVFEQSSFVHSFQVCPKTQIDILRHNNKHPSVASTSNSKANHRTKSRNPLHVLFNKQGVIQDYPKHQQTAKISIQKVLVWVNVFCFLFQLGSVASYAPVLRPLASSGTSFVFRLILGSPVVSASLSEYPEFVLVSSLGPFTMDFLSYRLFAKHQPYRLLTSGFLHGSAIHLFFNMNYLASMPKWLEENHRSLYLATYLVSIVTCSFVSLSGGAAFGLGASGGLCGLNGLEYVMHKRMGKKGTCPVILNFLILTLLGMAIPNMDVAGHVGGFLGGIVIAWLFGPQYDGVQNNNDDDLLPGKLPLWSLWAVMAVLALTIAKIPYYIWLGISRPGVLSGILMTPAPN